VVEPLSNRLTVPAVMMVAGVVVSVTVPVKVTRPAAAPPPLWARVVLVASSGVLTT
jgi:hypothetical protein